MPRWLRRAAEWGVLEEGAGDGDALALAAGELAAILADARGEAVGQLLDELPGVRCACGADDVLLVDVGATIGDVGGDAIVEQHHLLADPGKLATQPRQRQRAQRRAVEQDAALRGSKKRAMRFTRVLLPLPDEPTRATVSPGAISRQKSSMAQAAWSG